MQLFDTHAHLLDVQFDEDRSELIASLPEYGVCRVLEACCDADDIPKIHALVLLYDHVYGSAGVHPQEANHAGQAELLRVERAFLREKMVAVGEIGLDYHYEYAPRDVQKAVFDAQLSIAESVHKPVIIHDREAHGDTMDLLRAHRNVSGVLHCYSGSYEDACRYIDMGYHIAFGGALTFHNAVKQREIAAKLPIDRLVIETDCPYMTPEPHRGRRNDPKYLHLTLETLAAIRNISVAEAAKITFDNANRLYGLM